MLDFVSEFRLTIPQATIPYSFHEINNYNNSVSYNIVRGSTNLNSTFTIPNGTYDIVSMSSIFTSSLISSITSIIPLYIPVITFVYSYDKNKLTFSLSFNTTTTTITLLSTTGYTQVILSLGFNTTAILTDVTPLESYVSCNVSPSRCLYLLSNNLINSRSYNGYVSELSTANVLCCIPMNSTRYDYINYNPVISTINVLTNKTIDKINLFVQSESLDMPLPDMDLNYSLQMTFEHWIFQNIQRVLSPNNEKDKIQQLTDERNSIIDELNTYKNKLSKSIVKDNVKSKTKTTTATDNKNDSTN